uniref:Uncharacterized protein n=1 Tax=Arundo donax TaxID=35708 RepID=A0A0A9HFJ1_ARUDO
MDSNKEHTKSKIADDILQGSMLTTSFKDLCYRFFKLQIYAIIITL